MQQIMTVSSGVRYSIPLSAFFSYKKLRSWKISFFESVGHEGWDPRFTRGTENMGCSFQSSIVMLRFN